MKLLLENWHQYLNERKTDELYSRLVDFFVDAYSDPQNFEYEFWAMAPYQERSVHGGPIDGIYQIIDWPLLAGIDWDGIEICPYLQEFRRSNSGWYYGWDVASGCIWDSEALVGEPKLLWQRDTEKEGGRR